MNAINPSLILAATLAASLAQGSIVVVQRTETSPANGAPTVRVDCPAGMHALSGGIIPGNVFQAEVAANGPVYGATLLQYMPYGPAAAPTGWYGVIQSYSNASMTLTVTAVCTSDAGLSSVIATALIPAGTASQANFGGVLPACPAGTVATGGGGDVTNHHVMAITGSSPLLSTTLPGGYPSYNHPDGAYGAPVGWNTFVRNRSTTTQAMIGAAICAPYSGISTVLRNFNVPATTLPVGKAASATCPIGKIAIGGGMDMSNVVNAVTVYSTPSVPDTNPPAFPMRPDGSYAASDSWMASFYSYVTTGHAATTVAICADAPQATAHLFHNTGLNHYFMTSDEAEVTAIGNGAAGPGWTQLVERFTVIDRNAAAAGTADVCRFYGTPGIGPNSHFYTLEPAECAAVKQDPGWKYEATAFRAFKPTGAATCPAGTVNVYRVYNNRFAFNDSNHRYTTSVTTYNAMVANGWRGEGTVFCAIPAA